MDEELLCLINAARSGDEAAMEAMVKANMPLVRSIGARFAGRGIESEDIMQIGCIGLIKAIHRFEPSNGAGFSTYAFHLITGEIKRAIRDGGPIKVGRSLKRLSAEVERVRAEYECAGKNIRINELAESLDASEEDIVLALGSTEPIVSLSAPLDDEGNALCDFIPDEADVGADLAIRLTLETALGALSGSAKDVIRCRYFAEMTQTETAGMLGLSQSAVSRTEKKALLSLRSLVEER